MKKKVSQFTPAEIFKTFESESIEDSFIASENILDVAFPNKNVEADLLNFPFQLNETILVLCTNGYLKAKLETKNLTVKRNAVLIILPKQIFEISELSADFKVIVFILKASFWDKKDSVVEIMKMQEYFFRENVVEIPEEIVSEVLTICKLIKGKIEKKMPFSRQIIQQYINVLFYNGYALLLEKERQKSSEKLPAKEYVFEQFIRLVERNYKQERKIDFYAKRLHLTGKYLSALIRSASGKTAAQWIRECLIMEGRRLLKSGKMSIQQVSNDLNFYDQSHFAAFFKKCVGCSPRAYQKM
jgi:AraC-like DNA-binding protein